jgi:septal ring factor EnvC (AmiA/AmiB activator)
MTMFDDLKKAVEVVLAPDIAKIREDLTMMKADITIMKADIKGLDARLYSFEKNMERQFQSLGDKLDLHNRMRNLEKQAEAQKAS